MLQSTVRLLRRIAITVIGIAVLAFGIALLVLPGPAFVVIPAGLMVLAVEYRWARQLLNWLQTRIRDARAARIKRSRRRRARATA